MKRKEKAHLKADPFVHFIEKAITFLNNNRRLLMAGVGIALILVVALLVVFFFTNLSAAGENKLYASAFSIRSNTSMSVDQKIAKLQEIKFKKGISSIGQLFIAALYYEKSDLLNAEKTLRQYSGSRIAIINDQKKTLEAQILAAGGKSQEALHLLKLMLEDKQTQMGKELIILMQAKIQSKSLRQEEAVSSLKKIIGEYPNTPSANEAQNLLSPIEGESQSAQ
jgi:predicted negative regulator of RcsB-dependent stress response